MTKSYGQKFIRPTTVYEPEWGSQVIAYTRTPELMEYFRTYSPHGLASQGIWVVANVMDEDGQKYNLFRQYKAFDTTMTVASKEIPGLQSNPQQLFKPGEMYLGRCSQELYEEEGFIEIKPYLTNPTFNIKVRPQHISWQDVEGRLNLEFNAVGPALEYYCPGLWEDDMYRSEPHYVTGTLDGKPVSGYGVIDAAWGPLGCDFVQSKIYKLLEQYWVVWMNIFEDGSKECGVYLDGVDDFRTGYYNQNGKAAVTHHNKVEVIPTEDGFIKGAKITMDDWSFEFTSESKIAQATSFVSWASGKVLNTADTRKPVKSFAWFEFFPKG